MESSRASAIAGHEERRNRLDQALSSIQVRSPLMSDAQSAIPYGIAPLTATSKEPHPNPPLAKGRGPEVRRSPPGMVTFSHKTSPPPSRLIPSPIPYTEGPRGKGLAAIAKGT
ncbi:hypothetical protein NG791_17770 [Laspinema sp. D1]|uniref:hypothetical protein n=1 Tax=Laspinema palackyanum TaxID=3231601 RepID=UPI0034873356|nr:hypothetical protein [Laspinema sp. D2b]